MHRARPNDEATRGLNVDARIALHLGGNTLVAWLAKVDMEAISANDKATRVAPMPAKIPPYSMEAGPPFNNENWKVYAIASHADWTTISKLKTEGKLMYRCRRISYKTL